MFGGNAVFRESAVVPFGCLIQRILFAALFWPRGVARHLLQAQVAGVGHGCGVGMESDARLLEHSEIMPAAGGVCTADDRARRLVDDELSLQRVALFVCGRSMGVSVASMRTTSSVLSLLTRAFLPGSVNTPLVMSVSSHQRMLR